MSFWIITSWVVVAILTGINVFVFLKLKKAADQMMKMPGMDQIQKMMAGRNPQQMQAQMKAAMAMMGQMQRGRK